MILQSSFTRLRIFDVFFRLNRKQLSRFEVVFNWLATVIKARKTNTHLSDEDKYFSSAPPTPTLYERNINGLKDIYKKKTFNVCTLAITTAHVTLCKPAHDI